ncbi:MAG TPA: DUF4272 domain-containing protein [Ruminococcaceae bacterium]|nr:DUF4272 domain-containing protein [Oscillospiraceae bacterium]
MFKKKKVKSAEQRRAENNEKIKNLGIACYEKLPVLEDASQVKIRPEEEICKKAIATLLAIQVAFDALNDDFENSKAMFNKFINEYGVSGCLNEKENNVLNGKYTKQDLYDLTWSYETYWSLVWALGIVDDISIPSSPCDCERAIRIVGDCKDFSEFKKQVKMRDIDEILDMLDLYYRYHWATTEHRIRPDTPIGDLNDEVVTERRKGLEWLISDVYDWNEISLDT